MAGKFLPPKQDFMTEEDGLTDYVTVHPVKELSS